MAPGGSTGLTMASDGGTGHTQVGHWEVDQAPGSAWATQIGLGFVLFFPFSFSFVTRVGRGSERIGK